MRRACCVLMTLIFLLSLSGCSQDLLPQQTQEVSTSGDSQRLQADPGNYDRSKHTGYGSFQETEAGYYYVYNSCLYYADKTDMSNWVVVCPDPACAHSRGSDCVAQTESVFLKDGRLYFLSDSNTIPHIASEYSGENVTLLCSMSLNGTDIRSEHVYEAAILPEGGTLSRRLFPDGYALSLLRMNADGTTSMGLYLYDFENGEQVLLEKENVDAVNNSQVYILMAANRFALRGDAAVVSAMVDGTVNGHTFWLCDGEALSADFSQFPAFGGYLSGSTLRCFQPGDGYYDIDLLTGTRVRLFDAQLANSNARILLPNCIIESTLQYNNQDPAIAEKRAAVETHQLRYYDGIQWHNVSLTEEILNLPDSEYLNVIAVTSDSIIFSANVNGNLCFFRMRLDSEVFALEPCGSFS